MAQAFEIKGTTTILTDAVAGDQSTFVALGITDHDDTPENETNNHEHVINTNESGPDMPGKILNLGKTAIIRAVLVRYDTTELAALTECTDNVAAEGQIGILGADKKTFALQIQGVISGSRKYEFPFCRLAEPYRELDWGNKESRVALVIAAYPDPDALSTATTPLYTVSTVS